MSEEAVISYEAGRHAFYPKILIYRHFKHDEAGTFQGILLYLEVVDRWIKLQITIYEFNLSVKPSWGRCKTGYEGQNSALALDLKFLKIFI